MTCEVANASFVAPASIVCNDANVAGVIVIPFHWKGDAGPGGGGGGGVGGVGGGGGGDGGGDSVGVGGCGAVLVGGW